VELTPGQAQRTIPDGGTIPTRQTSAAEQLSDVLYAFDTPTRAGLGDLLRGLGDGVAGRGPQLNDALAVAPATMRDVTKSLGPLLARRGATAQLVAGGALLNAAIDPVRRVVADGFGQGADALRPLAEASASVVRTLEVAPGALSGIRASLGIGDILLGHLTSFADATARFTALAPPALRSLTAVLVEGRRPLRDARAVLAATRPAITPTLRLMHALSPELPHLTALFAVSERPLVLLGRYGCDLEGFAYDWRGFLGLGSKTETGPLGPYTELRTELAGGVATPGRTLPLRGSGQSDAEAPCVTVPAGGA
jgi:phospholipid/cholesterol/gamma-HCH transport system substrate-binding protein